MFNKERNVALFFKDLETAIGNSNLYAALSEGYVYTHSDDECGITVSSIKIMQDFGRKTFDVVRTVCLNHGMPDPNDDLI